MIITRAFFFVGLLLPCLSKAGTSPVTAPAAMKSPSDTFLPSSQDWDGGRPLKIAFRFRKGGGEFQMALTRDSVGLLAPDSTAGALEPDDEKGFEGAVRKRALSAGERDSAGMLMAMTRIWKGRKRYACSSPDEYAFTIWSDSLTLHCENCFSCSEGISMPEAKMLARFGKMTLWLNGIRGGIAGEAGAGE